MEPQVQTYPGKIKSNFRPGYGRAGDSAFQGGEASAWLRFWKTSPHTQGGCAQWLLTL